MAEPSRSDAPPVGLTEWAEARVARLTAPVDYGLASLLRSTARPGSLYVRALPGGSVWAWRPEHVELATTIARAGRVRQRWTDLGNAGGGVVAVAAAPVLGRFWLATSGTLEMVGPTTARFDDAVVSVRFTRPDWFRGPA